MSKFGGIAQGVKARRRKNAPHAFRARWRFRFLRALTMQIAMPLYAIFGIGSGWDLLALIHGAQIVHPECRGDYANCVYVFHWGLARRGLYEWCGADLDYAPGGWSQAKVRRVAQYGRHIRFIPSGESGRTGWRDYIGTLLDETEFRFGLVVHTCIGGASDIKRDLDLAMPMMDDRTTVLLADIDKVGPAHRYEAMVRREGWDGNRFRNFGLLQRRPFPKE